MMSVQQTVRTVIQQGIENYVAQAGERKIHWMESCVEQVKDARVILYGSNSLEGPTVEYHGPLGNWQSSMTSTLKLRGELRQLARRSGR